MTSIERVTITQPKILSHSASGKRRIKVAAYCRVSTELETQENSIDSQVRYYQNYIEQNHEWDFVRVYSDHGKSGTTRLHRDEFNQMIEDAYAGKIDLIVTKSVSRFSRNTVDTMSIVKELRNKGIGVFFEMENSNTLENQWDFVLTIHSAVAQEESRAKSESVKWGYQRKFEKGESVLSSLYGYRYKDRKYHVVESEKEIIKRVYREFLEGSSMNAIADGLNAERVTTRQGNAWSSTGIGAMLSNEKYTGDARQMKTFSKDFTSKKRLKNNGEVASYYIKDAHPSIISKEVYSLTQRELKRRKLISLEKASFDKDFSKCHSYSHRYALGNVMECAYCGAKYRRQVWTARGNRRVVWRCSTRMKDGVNACPDCPTILEEKMQHIVVMAVNSMIEDKKNILENLRTKINQLCETQKEEYKIELIRTVKLLEEKYLRVLKENIENSMYNAEKLQSILSTITGDIKSKKEELSVLDDKDAILKNELIYYNHLKQELENKEHFVIEYSEELVHTRINKITVADLEVKVILNSENTYRYCL